MTMTMLLTLGLKPEQFTLAPKLMEIIQQQTGLVATLQLGADPVAEAKLDSIAADLAALTELMTEQQRGHPCSCKVAEPAEPRQEVLDFAKTNARKEGRRSLRSIPILTDVSSPAKLLMKGPDNKGSEAPYAVEHDGKVFLSVYGVASLLANLPGYSTAQRWFKGCGKTVRLHSPLYSHPRQYAEAGPVIRYAKRHCRRPFGRLAAIKLKDIPELVDTWLKASRPAIQTAPALPDKLTADSPSGELISFAEQKGLPVRRSGVWSEIDVGGKTFRVHQATKQQPAELISLLNRH